MSNASFDEVVIKS